MKQQYIFFHLLMMWLRWAVPLSHVVREERKRHTQGNEASLGSELSKLPGLRHSKSLWVSNVERGYDATGWGYLEIPNLGWPKLKTKPNQTDHSDRKTKVCIESISQRWPACWALLLCKFWSSSRVSPSALSHISTIFTAGASIF